MHKNSGSPAPAVDIYIQYMETSSKDTNRDRLSKETGGVMERRMDTCKNGGG